MKAAFLLLALAALVAAAAPAAGSRSLLASTYVCGPTQTVMAVQGEALPETYTYATDTRPTGSKSIPGECCSRCRARAEKAEGDASLRTCALWSALIYKDAAGRKFARCSFFSSGRIVKYSSGTVRISGQVLKQ